MKKISFMILAVIFISSCTSVVLNDEGEAYLSLIKNETQAEIEIKSGFEGRIGQEDLEFIILDIDFTENPDNASNYTDKDFIEPIAKNIYLYTTNRKKFNRIRVNIQSPDVKESFVFETEKFEK